MTGVEDRVGTCNALVKLADAQAVQLLLGVLRDGAPGLLGLQEWDGPAPDLSRTHWRFARPREGGGPQVYDASRYDLQSIDAVELVPAGKVGHLPGRKDNLPASIATVGRYVDELLDERVALVNFHFTAEVQDVHGDYRLDQDHRARVFRHKAERRALRRLTVKLKRKNDRVYVVGDANFHRMLFAPLTSCWDDHPREEAAGTLGNRTPDYVFAPQKSSRVIRITTRSDHKTVVAVYPRRAA